jgi:hypothetical protein
VSATAKKGSGWAEKFEKWLTTGEPNEKGEYRGHCPIHEEIGEGTPSASFNFDKGQFYCFSEDIGMSMASLWSIVRDDEREAGSERPPRGSRRSNVENLDAARQRKRGKASLPTESQIEKWHEALRRSQSALKVIQDKTGWDLSTIDEFQIGYSIQDSRYTFPVRHENGELINVRKYKPNATGSVAKVLGITGHNDTDLFPRQVLAKNDWVVLTEGEKDAITGNANGFPTVTATGGAKRMPEHLAQMFADKVVFICYDVDDTGKGGATKAAILISRYAKSVHIVNLPLDAKKKEDLTDYFHVHGYTPKEFQTLLDEAKENPFTEREYASRVGKGARDVSLEQSMSAEHGNDPLAITVSVAGKVQPAYLLPKTVAFTCDQDYGNKCGKCDMHLRYNGAVSKGIARDNPVLLELIDVTKMRSDQILAKEVAGAPPTCPRLMIEEEERWNVEELVVMPSVDDRTEDQQNPISRRVYNVGEYNTPINTVSRLVGVNTTDPRNRRSVFQTWEAEQTKTNLDKFEMTEELNEALKIFRPKKGQTPIQKMKEIADDLEANITRIYGRPELHMAYDLMWHSVMDFKFRGVQLGKGWLEILVMGDTRTGKSEAALKLTDHYQSGVLKSCEGATLAGLVGGAQQTGNSWMITWGTIPLNDRRLVFLDEASGLSDKGIIEQMSAVRSSGRAQVTKIISQETSARTRLGWISNPPDGRPIAEMSRGAIEAIQMLIKNPEDIARFDFALAAASSDVGSATINSMTPPKVDHVYTRELCSALVAWAWSRRVDDVVWADDAEETILKIAEELGKSYIPEPPLIQAENVRVKLARIAVAMAARVFSATSDGEKVVVRKKHVIDARKFLDYIYGMDTMGYQQFSHRTITSRQRAEESIKTARRYLIKNEDAMRGLLSCMGSDFKVRDFEEFAGMSRDEAQITVRDLMGMKMLRRMNRGYIRMEPPLLKMLKDMEDDFDL